MLDKLVNGIDCGIRAISEVFAGPVYGYCRLETVDDDVLVADDGSLVSLLRLEGSLKHVGVEEYGSIVSGLTEKFQSSFSKPGHLVQVVFEYDPESSASRITELLRPSRLTAQNLGLHIGPLLDDWGATLQRYCALETCWPRRSAGFPAENSPEGTQCRHVQGADDSGMSAGIPCRSRAA